MTDEGRRRRRAWSWSGARTLAIGVLVSQVTATGIAVLSLGILLAGTAQASGKAATWNQYLMPGPLSHTVRVRTTSSSTRSPPVPRNNWSADTRTRKAPTTGSTR